MLGDDLAEVATRSGAWPTKTSAKARRMAWIGEIRVLRPMLGEVLTAEILGADVGHRLCADGRDLRVERGLPAYQSTR